MLVLSLKHDTVLSGGKQSLQCVCALCGHIYYYWFMYVCEASCVHIHVHVCTHFLSTNSWTEHKDHTSQNLRTYSTWHTGSWLLTMSVYHVSCVTFYLCWFMLKFVQVQVLRYRYRVYTWIYVGSRNTWQCVRVEGIQCTGAHYYGKLPSVVRLY